MNRTHFQPSAGVPLRCAGLFLQWPVSDDPIERQRGSGLRTRCCGNRGSSGSLARCGCAPGPGPASRAAGRRMCKSRCRQSGRCTRRRAARPAGRRGAGTAGQPGADADRGQGARSESSSAGLLRIRLTSLGWNGAISGALQAQPLARRSGGQATPTRNRHVRSWLRCLTLDTLHNF